MDFLASALCPKEPVKGSIVAVSAKPKLFRFTVRKLAVASAVAALKECLFMQDIPSIIKTCKAPGPLYLSMLSNEELQLLDNMMNRLYKIAEVAAQVTVAPPSTHHISITRGFT